MKHFHIKIVIVFVIFFISECAMLTSEQNQVITSENKQGPQIQQKLRQNKTVSDEKISSTIHNLSNQKNLDHKQDIQVKNSQKQSEQKQLSIFSTNQNSIQWPKKQIYYHVFSALNPRLVLDVASASDGFHDLILYPRTDNLNQKFYFQKVRQNFYRIGNGQYQNEYLKTSSKTITFQQEIIQKVKFGLGEDEIWQLIPAKENVPNSFYIVNEYGMALDVMYGYAQPMSEIVQYQFHRHKNQVWFLRPDQKQIEITDQNPQTYGQVFTQALQNVITKPQSINEALILEDMKYTLKTNDIQIPQWIKQPTKPHLQSHDAPFPVKYEWFEQTVKEKLADASEKLQKASPKSLRSQYIAMDCAKNNKITYVWLGQKQMPLEYQELLQKCQNNTFLLRDQHFLLYKQKWNILPGIKLIPEDVPIRQQVNLVKLLYLYFESGIYADFDTQINEDCWDEVYTEEMIFTNRIDDSVSDSFLLPVEEIVVPEESFMMVRNKMNAQVKRMIEEEILEHKNGGGDRWKECKYRQCLIVECQRHYRDNTYKKGYD